MNPTSNMHTPSGERMPASFLATRIFSCCLLLLAAFTAPAQGVVDQEAVRPVIENQHGDVDAVKQVSWKPYAVKSGELRSQLDAIPGDYSLADKIKIIELANRVRLDYIKGGMKLMLPSSFPSDYRAYSPWPYYYEAAKGLPKLFVIDKYTQSFGAYENGKLGPWGLVSSGRSNSSTPAGRYNFTWKTYFKLSNAAPEGEVWKLYWVSDFYTKIGLHVHQYRLPINKAASHGCVRTAAPDAEWNYSWHNGWVGGDNGSPSRLGTPVIVINANPPGNAAHWQISGDGVQSRVHLPSSLYDYALVERLGPKWESGW
jgi:hypothetical protein